LSVVDSKIQSIDAQTVFEIVGTPFFHCGFEARFYKFSIIMPCSHELIFRTFWLIKLQKNGATACQILRIKCNKFDFCWGSAPNVAAGAHLDSLAGFKGVLLLAKERKGEKREDRAKKVRKRWKKRKRERERERKREEKKQEWYWPRAPQSLNPAVRKLGSYLMASCLKHIRVKNIIIMNIIFELVENIGNVFETECKTELSLIAYVLVYVYTVFCSLIVRLIKLMVVVCWF